jgi:ABC-type Fe3+-hydroxamate transport system substrate-binding protein
MRHAGRLPAMVLVAALLALPAWAQTSPARIRGTIERLDGTTLVVKAADGTDVTITVPADATVVALANRTLADIRPGDFVGSAAVAGMDHRLHAQEVHIFPESLRGMGEGHRPMSGQDRSMTNAAVAEVARAPDGQELHLKYQGGEQVIEVGPEARIVAIVPADRGILVPGSLVLAIAARQPDGTLLAKFVQGQKDGVKPLE